MTREDRNDALHTLAEMATYLERLDDELGWPEPHTDEVNSIREHIIAQVDHLKHLIARQNGARVQCQQPH